MVAMISIYRFLNISEYGLKKFGYIYIHNATNKNGTNKNEKYSILYSIIIKIFYIFLQNK